MNNFLNYKKPPCSNCSTIQKINKPIMPINNTIMPINNTIIPINHKNKNNTLHFFPNLNQINDNKK
jgi:hypothetical protein